VQATYDLLAGLRATVRECLAALDGAAPDDPEVGRAFEDLERDFAKLGDPAGLLEAAQGPQRERLEQEFSDLARLHAVLTSAVSRDRDKLCGLLEQARAARSAMRSSTDEARSGISLNRSA
jgi:hypothetical protein